MHTAYLMHIIIINIKSEKFCVKWCLRFYFHAFTHVTIKLLRFSVSDSIHLTDYNKNRLNLNIYSYDLKINENTI